MCRIKQLLQLSLSLFCVSIMAHSVPVKILLINHTGKSDPSHYGQAGASYVLERALRQRFGDETLVTVVKAGVKTVSSKVIEASNLVVCNAEGTLHDITGGVAPLVFILENVVHMRKKLWIMNAGFEVRNKKTLRRLQAVFKGAEFIALRDSNSAQLFKSAFPSARFVQAADLTFLLPVVPNKFETVRPYILVSGCGGGCPQISTKKFFRFSGYSFRKVLFGQQGAAWDSFCGVSNLTKSASLLIGSRFHAATIATANGLPSVSFPGTSFKNLALARDVKSPCVTFQKKFRPFYPNDIKSLVNCELETSRIQNMRSLAYRNFPFEFTMPTLCTLDEVLVQKRWLHHLSYSRPGQTETFSLRFDTNTSF